MTRDNLIGAISAFEAILDCAHMEGFKQHPQVVIAQLAALPEEPAEGTYKLFVWTDHCTFAAVAHAKTVAQARELIEAEDLGGTDGSCPERAAARKMIYDETPGIYRGAQAVLMFDTGNVGEPAPWTARERRMRELLERGSALAEEALAPLWNKNNGFTDAEDELYTWKDSEVPAALSDTPPPDPRDEAMRVAEEALERSNTLLRASADFVEDNDLHEYTATWDEAQCDGSCLIEDSECAVADNTRALAAIRAARGGK